MYRNILVPLDGSTFGEHALPFALNLARKSGATLHLTHVLLPLSMVYADTPPFISSSIEGRLLEQQKTGQQAYLKTIAGRLTDAGAANVRILLLEGDVTEAIRKQVADVGAELVVMSTHGYGPFTRFWLGSVADELVRGSLAAPLVLVRPGEGTVDLTSVPSVKRVLLPLDGSPFSEQMIEPAALAAETAGAELTLLRIIKPLLPVSVPIEGQTFGHMVQGMIAETETLHEKIRIDAGHYLATVAGPLRQRGLTVHVLVEADDSPTQAILRHARTADLVALATHGYRGLSRLFLGSVADKIVRGVSIPVMVWHPRKV